MRPELRMKASLPSSSSFFSFLLLPEFPFRVAVVLCFQLRDQTRPDQTPSQQHPEDRRFFPHPSGPEPVGPGRRPPPCAL